MYSVALELQILSQMEKKDEKAFSLKTFHFKSNMPFEPWKWFYPLYCLSGFVCASLRMPSVVLLFCVYQYTFCYAIIFYV